MVDFRTLMVVRREFFGHLLFWVVLTLTYAISDWGHMPGLGDAILYELIYLPVRLFSVYINWYLLIPRLLYKGRITVYVACLALLLVGSAVAQRFFTLYWAYPVFFPEYVTSPVNPFEFIRVVQSIVVIASSVAFATGIKLFLDWYEERNRNRKLALEKREAELKYLKAQINPHFLFNALNNIYGLALERSRNVPRLILKLSELLSFSIYESSSEYITLKQEIELIEGYIELERSRYEGKVNIKFDIAEDLDPKMKIGPLLLMPLVENAFKFCDTSDATPYVHFSMSVKGTVLFFSSENSIVDELQESTDGIGLKNLKRRLQLLYPDHHTLILDRRPHAFNVVLQIPAYA